MRDEVPLATKRSPGQVLRDLELHAPALAIHARAASFSFEQLLQRPLDLDATPEMNHAAFAEACSDLEDGPALRSALRKVRHTLLIRVALREIYELAPIDQTAKEISYLADAAIDAALQACMRSTRASLGRAVNDTGQEVPFVVLGMGKLGGSELNLGSDIDLCMFYESDDGVVEPAASGSVGGAAMTVHELYSRVATSTARALSEITEDGFCFRVDLRLRPEGSKGPVVSSFASAERYYEAWGRTWERAALVRARPVAGDRHKGDDLLRMLRPFVYRKTVRPELAVKMSNMLQRSRRELQVDMQRDVKLGRGGIREIEFFVQTLQLIWGGVNPSVQHPNTLRALHELETLGLVSHAEASALRDAWSHLRRTEHRIHMRLGYQAHEIPRDVSEAGALARSLGWKSLEELEQRLGAWRTRTHELFAALQPSDVESVSAPPWTRFIELSDLIADFTRTDAITYEAQRLLCVADGDADEALSYLKRLAKHPAMPLSAFGRQKEPDLAPLLLQEVSQSANPTEALRHLADFFSRLPYVHPYGRTLVESPPLARRLVSLFGASPTLAASMIGHPQELDDVLFAGHTRGPSAIVRSHAALLDETHDVDEETFVERLRERKRHFTLRAGVDYIDGRIDVREVAQTLTLIAECQISSVLDRCLHAAGLRGAEFAVVGLGKLGARELSFRSDLDLMFLYRDGEFGALETLTRIAQRVLRLLSQPSREGSGYTLDTRLRPSGAQGLLVLSVDSFERHHASRAAPWERQALIRARPVGGPEGLKRVLEATLERLAYQPAVPLDEIARLKARTEKELGRETATRHHVKYGYGAILEIEFLVQALQLSHHQDRSLHTGNTLDALDAMATARGAVLSDVEVQTLRDAYQFCRTIEYMSALLDENREPVLQYPSRFIESLARMARIEGVGQATPGETLLGGYRRRAEAVRGIFERRVGSLAADAPWH